MLNGKIRIYVLQKAMKLSIYSNIIILLKHLQKMSFTGGHSPPAAPLHSSPLKSALCPQDKVRPNGANCTSPPATGLLMPSPRGALLLCSSDDDSGCVMDDFYAWVPPRTKPDLVHHFFAALPPDKVPRIGTPGEQWRKRQLQRQLPPQDADARFCGNLNAKETCELEAFVRERREKALGRGEVRRLSPAAIGTSKLYCHQCKNCIASDEMAVWAPRRFGARAFWHPKCFVCVECGELLVDLIHFAHAQNIFCGRHHAELIKPRCSNCDELIFSEECTEAEGRVWHMRHFCCVRCAVPLGGQRYVMNSAEAQPTCVPCCRESAKFSCATCGNKIVADRPHIAQGNFHWHADERCFCCSDCDRALLGKAFSLLESNGRLFCALRGCFAYKHCPKNGPLKLPLPPPSFPPPPPPAVHQRQFSPIPPPRVRFDLRRRTKTPPATPTENVYETVAAAAPPPAPSTSSGCSANGSMASSAGSVRSPQAHPNYLYYQPNLWKPKSTKKYFVPEASESLDAEETPENPVRRCRSVDGRSERRSKCVKNKSANKNGQIAVGNLYSGAPPPNARGVMPSGNGEGGSLAAALALASSGSSRRRKRRQRRRGNLRRQQLLYWESANSLSSADDSDSSLSSCSSSSSSDGDELNPLQRNVLLNRYLHTLATRSKSASVAGSPASGKCVPSVCRIATTRPTTAKCANNAKDRRGANAGGNCRIS